MNYINDILIFSSNFEQHIQHLKTLFNAILKEGFRIIFMKCTFAVSEVGYLGHVIGHNSVRPLTDNLIAIKILGDLQQGKIFVNF